jgi:superfamily I DNA/RNA helicase
VRLPTYEELSKEQDRVYNLPLDESCLVTGPPGTGKTVMALYRASALDQDDRDVALLMYSRLLNQYVQSALEELGIEGRAATFHSWLGKWWWSAYHQYFPQVRRFVPDWTEIIAKLQTNPPRGNGSRPYVIVDEAQDLDRHFFMMTSLMSDGVTVFADENQRITEGNSKIEEIRAYAQVSTELQLLRNYRNGTEIARLASHFYTGAQTGIAEVVDDRRRGHPQLRRFASLNEEVEHIARYVGTNTDLEVGVFVPTKSLQTKFFNRLRAKLDRPGQVQQYLGGKGATAIPLDWDSPGVKVVTYASSKGLEFDAVFVPQLQMVTWDLQVPDIRMQYYVLATRARTHLVFSYSGDTDPAILSLFPDDPEILERHL